MTYKKYTEFNEATKRVNKFNIHWQLVRTNAKGIKDVDQKISYVLAFLNAHKNVHNYGRVRNWLLTSGMAYKEPIKSKFADASDQIQSKYDQYSSLDDLDNDLTKIPKDNLQKVYKDLLQRKYGFQFKSVPQAHTDFMQQLKAALK